MLEEWFDPEICVPAPELSQVKVIYRDRECEALYLEGQWEEFDIDKYKGEPLHFDDDPHAKPEKWRPLKNYEK